MGEHRPQSFIPTEKILRLNEERAQNLAAAMSRTAQAIKAQRTSDQQKIMALQATVAQRDAELSRSRRELAEARAEHEQQLRVLRNELATAHSDREEMNRRFVAKAETFETFLSTVGQLFSQIEQQHRELVSIDDRAEGFFLNHEAQENVGSPAETIPTNRVDEFRNILDRFRTAALVPASTLSY